MNETILKRKITSQDIGVKLCVCLGPGNHLDCQYSALRLLKGAEEKYSSKNMASSFQEMKPQFYVKVVSCES